MGVAGVVVLHEVGAVDADAQVVALADFAAVEEGEVAGEGEQDAAADDAEVAPDGAAEVGGDHDVDFAGFDGLVALELVVEADEFEFDAVVELEAADDFADGVDDGAGGAAAVGEHADFEVEVDFAGAEGVLLFGDAVVFDDAQADVLAPGPLFEQADLDGAGGDADGLAVEGGVVVGKVFQ